MEEGGGGVWGSSSVRRQSQCLETITEGENPGWVLGNSHGLLLKNTRQAITSMFFNCTTSWLFS